MLVRGMRSCLGTTGQLVSHSDQCIRGYHGEYFISRGRYETVCVIISVAYCREGVAILDDFGSDEVA
jgi:hypothetical protein